MRPLMFAIVSDSRRLLLRASASSSVSVTTDSMSCWRSRAVISDSVPRQPADPTEQVIRAKRARRGAACVFGAPGRTVGQPGATCELAYGAGILIASTDRLGRV